MHIQGDSKETVYLTLPTSHSNVDCLRDYLTATENNMKTGKKEFESLYT